MTWDQQRKFHRMGGETLNQLGREVRCQGKWSEEPSSSYLCVGQSEEPVTGPLIPAGHESGDESGVEVVFSGVVGFDDEGSWHGQVDDSEEGDTSIV